MGATNPVVIPISALDQFSKTFKKLRGEMTQTERSLKNISKAGKTASASITAPAVVAGGLILKTAYDFDSAMNRVAAITTATGEEFGLLEQKARELGATTQYSATESADAMGFLSMAGFTVNETLTATGDVLNLAAAAGVELAESADIASNILTGYGKTASDLANVNDVLVKTFTSTNTNLVQLGEAMTYVGPVASGFGVQFEETAAAIGLLGNAGIQASMAGTSLRGMLSKLSSPAREAQDAMVALGVTQSDLFNNDGSAKSLVDIISVFEQANISATDAMTIFGERAGPGFLALVDQGSDKLRDLTIQLQASGGSAQHAADRMMEGLPGAWKSFTSVFQEMQLAIGNSGLKELAIDVLGFLRDMMSAVAGLNPELLKWGTVIVGVAAAAGPLLMILGSMQLVIPLVAGGWALLSTAVTGSLGVFGLAATGLLRLSGMILPAITKAAGFAAAAFRGAGLGMRFMGTAMKAMVPIIGVAWTLWEVGTAIYENWDSIADFFGNMWIQIKGYFASGALTVLETVNNVASALGFDTFSETEDGLKRMVAEAEKVKSIQKTAQPAGKYPTAAMRSTVAGISGAAGANGTVDVNLKISGGGANQVSQVESSASGDADINMNMGSSMASALAG